MKIQDMKISTRLYLALGVILALLAILAWEAVMQTKTMYDHPLQVRRAVGALKAEVAAQSSLVFQTRLNKQPRRSP